MAVNFHKKSMTIRPQGGSSDGAITRKWRPFSFFAAPLYNRPVLANVLFQRDIDALLPKHSCRIQLCQEIVIFCGFSLMLYTRIAGVSG